MDKINILITGAAGFIGYHLVKSYAGDPRYNVIGIDDFSRGKKDKDLKKLKQEPNIDILTMDLLDKESYNDLNSMMVVKQINKFDIVYHLAAVNGTKNFYKYPNKVLDVNINSTINLLKWLDNQSCGKFVFTSSCEAYYGIINASENPDELIPTDEDIPLGIDDINNSRASYAVSKIAGESIVINMCKSKNIKYNIVRYHNVYGPRMGDCHVIPELISRIQDAKDQLELYGGDQTRSFMFVADAVHDTRKVGENNFNNEIFNVGVQKETEIKELAKRLIEYSGKELEIIEQGAPSGSVTRRCPDMTKFKEFFGRGVYIPFTTGLLETYVWYMNNAEIKCSV